MLVEAYLKNKYFIYFQNRNGFIILLSVQNWPKTPGRQSHTYEPSADAMQGPPTQLFIGRHGAESIKMIDIW